MIFMGCSREFSMNMANEWKGRGHEVEDHQVAQSDKCINALRDYGLLKFFRTSGLRDQNELLEYLVGLWDVSRKIFIIGDQELEIEISDIYFIIVLSRRGERIKLSGACTRSESTNMFIRRHCLDVEKTMSGKVDIKTITNLPLRTILHTMACVAGA